MFMIAYMAAQATVAVACSRAPAASGASMYPGWGIDDQRSSPPAVRLARDARFPSVIVTAATAPIAGPDVPPNGPSPAVSTSVSPANPPALETTDRNAATGSGPPW